MESEENECCSEMPLIENLLVEAPRGLEELLEALEMVRGGWFISRRTTSAVVGDREARSRRYCCLLQRTAFDFRWTAARRYGENLILLPNFYSYSILLPLLYFIQKMTLEF